MALTDTAIRLAKTGDTDRKLADEKGLYLLVTATGSKLWRLKYRIGGKEKKLALGAYPEVGLKDARARRDEARKVAQAGNDPAVVKREARIAKRIASGNTFAAVADEYIAKSEAEGRAPITLEKIRWLLRIAYPMIGDLPISKITAQEALILLLNIVVLPIVAPVGVVRWRWRRRVGSPPKLNLGYGFDPIACLTIVTSPLASCTTFRAKAAATPLAKPSGSLALNAPLMRRSALSASPIRICVAL